MALNIIQNYLTNNRCYQQAVKRNAIGIQLHSIGTGQGTAQSVADYWNQPSVSACVHYIADCDTPGKVLQCLPEEYYSWADAGYGNRNLITIEMCESDYIKYTDGASYTILDEAKFKADILRGYETAVNLCAKICRDHGWIPTTRLPSGLFLISSHDEGRLAGLSSAHVDPSHIWKHFGLTMDGFRSDVETALNAGEQPVPPNQPSGETSYIVQTGSFTVKENAQNQVAALKEKDFDAFVKKEDTKYTVQAGSFRKKENADALKSQLMAEGFEAVVKTKNI